MAVSQKPLLEHELFYMIVKREGDKFVIKLWKFAGDPKLFMAVKIRSN